MNHKIVHNCKSKQRSSNIADWEQISVISESIEKTLRLLFRKAVLTARSKLIYLAIASC